MKAIATASGNTNYFRYANHFPGQLLLTQTTSLIFLLLAPACNTTPSVGKSSDYSQLDLVCQIARSDDRAF